MILDGTLFFSDIALGDVMATTGLAVGDHASTNIIDGGIYGATFSAVANGGAYVNPFFVAKVHAAFTTTTTTGTVQLVVQESADGSTNWLDLVASPIYNVNNGDLAVNYPLFMCRLPQIRCRYLRLVYRIGTEAITAGNIIAFLTLDASLQDLFARSATTVVTAPTGAMDQSTANGVLDS